MAIGIWVEYVKSAYASLVSFRFGISKFGERKFGDEE